jgi:hypothetical protein
MRKIKQWFFQCIHPRLETVSVYKKPDNNAIRCQGVTAILHLPLILAENLLRKGLEGLRGPRSPAADGARRPERAATGGHAEPRKARFPAWNAGNAPKFPEKFL